MKKLQERPGIVGYVVQAGDTLWSVAKKFCTTQNKIVELNGLTERFVKTGDKLLLEKNV